MSFGFGKKLGIDIPGELNGNIPSPAYYDRYHGVNRWNSMSIISPCHRAGGDRDHTVQLANLAALISTGDGITPRTYPAIGREDSLNPVTGQNT